MLHAGGTNISITTKEYRNRPFADFEHNAEALAQGQRLYRSMNCMGCHAGHGGGGIGPALSDDLWIYGWQPEMIFHTIVDGSLNGMPSFGGKLTDNQVWQLVAYVRSLSGLTGSDAAPGRSDQISGAVPPNSLARAKPRTSTAHLDELHRKEQTEFERMGWLNGKSGHIRVPSSVVQALAGQRGATVRTRTESAVAPALNSNQPALETNRGAAQPR